VVSGSLNAVRLQRAIEKAVESVADSGIEKAVAIVAEYPAHLPRVAGNEQAIASTLGRILHEVMLRTEREEVRVRVQLLPAAGELSPEAGGVLGAEHGPLALVSISDREAPFSGPAGQAEPAAAHETPSELNLDLDGLCTDLGIAGAQIWVEPVHGPGNSVWLALPLRSEQGPAAELDPLRQAVHTRLSAGLQSGQLILLYVEDEALRALLMQELGSQGYRMLASSGPADVLSMARANAPDLIILDLQARSPTALDIATLLKQDSRTGRTPVLFLTAIEGTSGEMRMEVADFVLRQEGTGAMVAAIEAVLRSGVHPTARVMVIEPDDVLRENIILHIQARGYPVIEARTPEESVALAERVSVGIALVNARLAEERDYWLLRQLRQSAREVSIYVLGEAITAEEGKAAMNRGASGYGETGQLPELLDRVQGNQEDQGVK